MVEENKLLGVVNAVGLERDEQEYRNFTLTVGIKIKTDKKITYTEGEKLMRQLQKDLMGKNIELGAIAVLCPVCSKSFNSEQGMKQHLRLQHNDKPKKTGKKKAEKKKTPAKKKKAAAKKAPAKKKRKKTSKKK